MRKSVYLWVFLCCCLSVGSVLPAEQANDAVVPVSRADRASWVDRHNEKLKAIQSGEVGMILVGDSITHNWEKAGKNVWNEFFSQRNAVNLGFGGDRTQHVLWRLNHGEIDGINPKVAMVMIGTNNSNGDDNTAEEIADGIKAIVMCLRDKLPETKILVLAIFPRGDVRQRATKTVATYNAQWGKNDRASQIVSEMADNKHIFFLNINDAFLD
ncbi:MAG: GDSL-type esterase/lipase family protein, partial [Kiritimatiellales bacterium]